MPRICVFSVINFDVNAVPLSVMIVVGRYACFVKMSIRTFAAFQAVASTSR